VTEKEQKIPDKLPDGFDREAYEQVEPHFIAALQKAIKTGQTLREFVSIVIRQFGARIQPYLKHFILEVQSGKINLEVNPYRLEGEIKAPGERVPEGERGEKPMSADFHEDDDIKFFREEYPDVYEFVLKVINGACDDQTLQAFKDEYGEDCLNDFLKILSRKASSKDIEAFEQNYPDIYIAIKKLLDKHHPPKESLSGQSSTKKCTKKGDFIGQKYEVYDVIGEGGFGIVYLVYSREKKSAYALKTFRDEYLADITTRERFRKEAQVWVDLERHPYLVRAYFVDKISGRLYIAMEHIAPDEQGLNTLDAYLRKRPPDLAQTLRWAIQFCHGMEHAYSRGIKAHRDIKPANIMIDQNKNVKISDFGLAGVISSIKPSSDVKLSAPRNSSGETYQTMEGTAFGTPPYMSPEQFENAAGCDERSDIYSFGVVLYQMVSGGNLPFYPDMTGSKADNVLQDWYRLHCKSAVPKLNSPLSTVIQKCLEKEQRNRYQTFKDLRSDLERLFNLETGEVFKTPELQALNAWEWINKGFSLGRLEKHKEAITCYDNALEIDQDDTLTWCNKGASLNALGNHQDAIICYNKALKIDSKNVSAWNNKGNVLSTLGNHLDAIACYDKALDIEPMYADIWINKGVALGKLGSHHEAIACYDKALDIEPMYADIWINKGVALGKLGSHHEAIACYDRVIELGYSNADVWYSKGFFLYELDKYHEAITCYDKALELNPEYVSAWYAKALSEDKLNMNHGAIRSYKHFLELATHQYTEQIEYSRRRLKILLGGI
jgi:serine/threonine protein kinase